MEPEALLVTGSYGAGKSSAVEEMAEALEARRIPYGALDLDWLGWFDVDDDEVHERIYWRNLETVVENYRSVGVRRFLLALTIEDRAELERCRQVLAMPTHVVRLTLDLARVRARLGAVVTTGRAGDLREAESQIEQSVGVGLEDFTVPNDGTIMQTAATILQRIGWNG